MTCHSLPKKSQPKLQMQKFKEKLKKNLTETLEFWEMLTAAETLVVAYIYILIALNLIIILMIIILLL